MYIFACGDTSNACGYTFTFRCDFFCSCIEHYVRIRTVLPSVWFVAISNSTSEDDDGDKDNNGDCDDENDTNDDGDDDHHYHHADDAKTQVAHAYMQLTMCRWILSLDSVCLVFQDDWCMAYGAGQMKGDCTAIGYVWGVFVVSKWMISHHTRGQRGFDTAKFRSVTNETPLG